MLPDRLPHRCTIRLSLPLQDDILGDVDDTQLVDSDVACWVQPASDREMTVYQRRDQVVTHKVYFKGNPGLRPGYIIIPADGPEIACPFAGANLEVRSANEATAGLGVLWRIMAEELQPR